MPGVNSIAVFELWKDGSRDGEQIAMWLQKRFTQHPEEITEFLRPFWRRASEAFTDDLMKRFEVFEAEFGRFIAPALVAEAGISYFDQAKFEHLPWRDQEAVRVLMNIGQRHGLSPKELTSRPAGQGE
jgi:hypothetical protein